MSWYAVAYEFPRSLVSVACEVSEVEDWQRVHVKLRRIARKRAALDREELELIREAIRIAIWRHVGGTSIRDYDALVHVEDRSDHVAHDDERAPRETALVGESFHVESARRDAVLALTTLGFAKGKRREPLLRHSMTHQRHSKRSCARRSGERTR